MEFYILGGIWIALILSYPIFNIGFSIVYKYSKKFRTWFDGLVNNMEGK